MELELSFFDVICGMDDNDELDKPSLVKKAMEFCNCSNYETVLVGDSYNNWSGALEVGIQFIGVSYGFGFKQNESCEFLVADTIKKLNTMISNLL